MELHSKCQVVLVVCVLLLPALCLSQFIDSRATFDIRPGGGGSTDGACGFGDYGGTENSGKVAAVSGLWRGGAGCGACYQVKCKDTKLCSPNGVIIVATNMGSGDRTDFIISKNGSLGLGVNSSASDEIVKKGTVDIQYKRVACTFDGSNVKIKISERSRFSDNYLAIAVIYVPGSNDIVALQISNNGGNSWIPLERSFGGVFHLPNAPRGPFKVRVQFRGSPTWVVSPGNVIPADWKVGDIYDTGISVQIQQQILIFQQ